VLSLYLLLVLAGAGTIVTTELLLLLLRAFGFTQSCDGACRVRLQNPVVQRLRAQWQQQYQQQ
jgi:hypothetical protein